MAYKTFLIYVNVKLFSFINVKLVKVKVRKRFWDHLVSKFLVNSNHVTRFLGNFFQNIVRYQTWWNLL
jgi:hypothetical protein